CPLLFSSRTYPILIDDDFYGILSFGDIFCGNYVCLTLYQWMGTRNGLASMWTRSGALVLYKRKRYHNVNLEFSTQCWRIFSWPLDYFRCRIIPRLGSKIIFPRSCSSCCCFIVNLIG